MYSRRNILICGIVACLFFFLTAPTNADDPAPQIITHTDEILNANPMPAGEKVQTIKVAQDDTATINIVRIVAGAEVKAHFHKTHNETFYVVKGKGQTMLADNKWIDIKPGTVHFNPMTKIHATRNTGNKPLMLLSIFTPAMKEPDRHFVQ